MDDVYDLVVIGAGPAGQVAAELGASFGRRVLIVERNKPDGVVATIGGAPTKALSWAHGLPKRASSPSPRRVVAPAV